MNDPIKILENMIERYPILKECRDDIQKAYEIIVECYKNKGKILVCGNGGSAADSEHIVSELMKGFLKKRPLTEDIKNAIMKTNSERGKYLAEKLQGSLPVISLTSQVPLCTAISNDTDPSLIFAQQVLGYGKPDDVLIGISTSGNAENVLNALVVARSLNMKTIGLSGRTGGKMKDACDIIICVPEDITPKIQELHLPVYHTLCAIIEAYFF